MANIITTLSLEMSENWYVSKKINSVGRVGENTVTKLIIEPVEILDATYELEIMSADGSKNVAELTVEDNTLYLILTANMLTVGGITKMQLRAVFEDNSIKKSNIFELKVSRSISATDYYEEYSVTIFDQLVAQCQEIIDGAEGYVERAETAAGNAEDYSESASASATAASNSADNAATSETNASNSANAASTSAGNAHDYELNAKSYSESASSSATNASTSETNAHNYELSAKSYSESASTSATNASTSETNARNSATAAHDSEVNAASSENNASTYATNAYNSAQNAATSETNAHNSETAAGNSATAANTSATNAHTSETNAANSATAAGNSATAANTSAVNAHNSEVAAGNSETNAGNSATEAAASAASVSASVAQINENTYRINDLEAIIGGYTLADLPTGAVASITDGTALLMPSLKIGIEPVQDLNGYDHPWAGGAGKNLANIADQSGITSQTLLGSVLLQAGTYTLSAMIADSAGVGVALRIINITGLNTSAPYSTTEAYIKTKLTFTLEEEKGVNISMVGSASGYNGSVKEIQIEQGTTATSYEPYSNICPISGWTAANVVVSPTTSASDGTTYNVQFTDGTNPLTVYGGNLNVISGLLTVTDAYIASYNGETLPSTWISDRDVYAAGTTPTAGAEVCYTLANSVTYQLTPTQIRTLVGNNNIWADTGNIIEGKYYKSPS